MDFFLISIAEIKSLNIEGLFKEFERNKGTDWSQNTELEPAPVHPQRKNSRVLHVVRERLEHIFFWIQAPSSHGQVGHVGDVLPGEANGAHPGAHASFPDLVAQPQEHPNDDEKQEKDGVPVDEQPPEFLVDAVELTEGI